MRLDLAVTGIGSLNPAGLTALVALHNVRAGMSRLALQPFPDRLREWVAGASIPMWVSEGRERRLSVLADRAIRAALERAGVHPDDRGVLGSTAVILGCPESLRPGYHFPPSAPAFRELIRDSLLESVAMLEVVAAGACSAQVALGRAATLLDSDRVTRCVIGAADTQLQLRTVRWHEDNFRLKCSYITDGLMPAEAACFIVLERADRARARDARIAARIVSSGTAREHATVVSDQPNAAEGLTAAMRVALEAAGVRPSQVGMVWADLNGESYRAREWAFTEVRLGFTTSTELVHPADVHGDLGAATDASLLALAAMSHGTGWAEGKPVAVFSGSEGGWRAATVLAAPERTDGFVQVSQRLPRVFSHTFTLPAPPEREDFRRAGDPPRAYFEWQIREEHRDALASLHYQRKAILRDKSIPWPRLVEPEQRMLNHVDAVVAGGAKSMAAVAAGVEAAEEGHCFAGAFLIGALPAAENRALIERSFVDADDARLAGVTAGLVHAPDSHELEQFVRGALTGSPPSLQALAVSVAGHRRIDIAGALPALTTSTDPGVLAAAANACRQLRVDEARSGLRVLIGHEDVAVRKAALFALLRVLPGETAAFARSNIDADRDFDGALSLCLGIAGQLRDAALLMQRVDRNPRDRDAVAALGVLGAPGSVPDLISLLQSADEGINEAAGDALNLMAGLHARERAIVSVPIDEGDGGTADTREVERSATSTDFWTEWWHRSSKVLDANMRWRRGSSFTLGACIDELADPLSAFDARWRAYLELTSRARTDFPFEPDWFVPRQERAIGAWTSWWASQESP